MCEPVVSIDECHTAAEPAHRLRQFQSDVASTQYQEMFRDGIQFQGFNMGERTGFGQSRDGRDGRPRPRANDDLVATDNSRPAVSKLHL